MPAHLIPSFLFFCFVNGITPGPANLCSLSAAVNYGKKQALRQWRGLFTGFAIVSLVSVLVNYFLGNVLGEYVRYLSFIGAAYLLWMAWKLVRPLILHASGTQKRDDKSASGVSFWTGLFVNLTNVKIMVFCMTALSSYVLPYNGRFIILLAVGAFLPFTGPICNLAWLFAGVKMQKLFEKHRIMFNIVMALSLVYCAVTLIL